MSEKTLSQVVESRTSRRTAMVKKVKQVEIYRVDGSKEEMLDFIKKAYEESGEYDSLEHSEKQKIARTKNENGEVDEEPYFEVTLTKKFPTEA
jgi:hypothetical protein